MHTVKYALLVSVFTLNAGVVLAQTQDSSSGSFVQQTPSNQAMPPLQQGTTQSGNSGSFDPNKQQGQFGNDPNKPDMRGQMPPQFNGQNGGQNNQNDQQGAMGNFSQEQQQKQQEMQKEQEARMLKSAQKGLAQMQKMIAGMEKRIAAIGKKGGIIPAVLTSSLQQAKDLMSKAGSASTMEEFQSAGLEDMRDLMQTINDEMQKAEMSTQFPAMLKQANRALVQQKKMLASAQKKAASLKVNVDGLLASWQKAVDAMAQGITGAQQSFQTGNTEDAVAALKDNVFDAMQTIGDYAQTFGMISNSQKMLAAATRELVSIEKKIAVLKKQAKDTSDAESAVTDAKAKVQAVKDAIAQPDVDPDTLISAIQDAQDAKETLYAAMYDLTGQAQYNQQTQQQTVPGLSTQQFQVPPGMQQFFGGFGQQQQGENGQGGQGMMPRSGAPGTSGGFMQPGNQGGGSGQIPGTQGGSLPFSGPQSVGTTTSSSQMASVLESLKKQVAELWARLQGKTQ